jgi:hypothetical protein
MIEGCGQARKSRTHGKDELYKEYNSSRNSETDKHLREKQSESANGEDEVEQIRKLSKRSFRHV